MLEGERQVIARGEAERSSLTATNYQFLANGVDADGLANVLMSPRRHERTLVAGTMFLTVDGDLVRVEGRLAKNPSFWVRNVDIVRRYERINALVMPVSLESRAELRMLGDATLHVTYAYTEIDGRPVRAEPKARIGQAF